MWLFWLLVIGWFVAIPFVVPKMTRKFMDGSYKRFSIRSLLLLTAFVAFLLWAVPTARQALRWRATEQAVTLYFAEISKSKNLEQRSGHPNGQQWTLANFPYREQRRTDVPGHKGQTVTVAGGDPITADSEEHRKQGHVYVNPPGEWASTLEEAIQLLRDNL